MVPSAFPSPLPRRNDVDISSLAIQYSQDGREDMLRMTLRGELDLASADTLLHHLRDVIASNRRVELDLSPLRFMDCSGLNAIAAALADARRAGAELQVDPRVTPRVGRMIRLADADGILWPQHDARERVRIIDSRRAVASGLAHPAVLPS